MQSMRRTGNIMSLPTMGTQVSRTVKGVFGAAPSAPP